MNRERLAWLVSIMLIGLLAFQINGSLAQRDDDYAFVRTLVDIHRQVDNNYVEPVDEAKLRQGAIDGMMEQLDPYSVYVPPPEQEQFDRMLDGTFKGVGIQLNQQENGDIEVISPVDGSPALKAGVLAGDIILKINGQDLKGMKLTDVIKKISSGPLEVHMRVRHPDGQEVDLPPMIRQEIIMPTVKGYRRKPDGSWDWWVSTDPKVAYVRITQFTPDTFKALKPTVEELLKNGMKGMILDLRFNPGGRLDQAIEVVNLFVKDGVIVRTKGRSRPEDIERANPKNALDATFPMIVLVNEHSASAAEIVSGSLMDNHRALVLGTRTFGKGSVQEVMPLGDKEGLLKLTIAYYYLPSGRLVHKKKGATDWGVEPQIVVPMDETQEKAVLLQQADTDVIGHPQSTSRGTTQPATRPATQPTDSQLEAAISTMIGHIVLQAKDPALGEVRVAAPATAPATQAASGG